VSGSRLAKGRPDRALGFADETWWSRFATPACHVWAGPGRPLRLVEQPGGDGEPKALAAYGLYLPTPNEVLLRFVDGRPVGALTIRFLHWCAARLAARGIAALLRVRDHAAWHVSTEVRTWLRAHNRAVKRVGVGVRLIVCRLPVKRPWRNPIAPKWVHGKRRALSHDRILTARETAARACAALGCAYEPHLTLAQ